MHDREKVLLEALSPLSKNTYRSLAAARRDGWVEWQPWHYGGERLEIKGHLLMRGHREAQSESEWNRRGMLVHDGAEPHTTRRQRVQSAGKAITYHVYREDQIVKPKRAETDFSSRDHARQVLALLEKLAPAEKLELRDAIKRLVGDRTPAGGQLS